MTQIKQYADSVYHIIGVAMEVHNVLGSGLLESVYQEALAYELLERGIESEREKEISIYYKNHLLDKKFRIDLIVDNIIVELKSVSSIVPAHRAQLCNYLRLTKKSLGLLINFGESNLIGERWAFDAELNQCFLVDRHMNPVYDVDYSQLLSDNEIE